MQLGASVADFNYSLWEEEDDIPARSRLYSLKMEGTDGRTQEALLDYCQRLARAHRVPITELLKAEIIPLTEIRGALYTNRFSTEYAKTFNGYCKYAAQVAKSLQTLTGQPSLDRGTFLHWKPVLDAKGSGLLHPERRWCRSCLAEAQDAGSITHALIWSVSIITHCPIHLTPLENCCDSCGATQPFISDNLPLGRCAQCGSPLGARDGLWSGGTFSDRQQFFGNAVSEMIAMGERAQELALPEVLSYRLHEVVKSHFSGSISQLEKEIGFRKQLISHWVRMESRPQFHLLLEMCYRMKISPVHLLSGAFAESGEACCIQQCEVHSVRSRRQPTDDLVTAIKADVDLVLESDSEFVEAKALAKKHGISIGYFKYWFPVQHKIITDHRRRVQNLLSRARIDRLETQTRAIVRELYSVSRRISRNRIGVALQSAGICIKDPVVRAAALEERERLQSQAIKESTGPIDEN